MSDMTEIRATELGSRGSADRRWRLHRTMSVTRSTTTALNRAVTNAGHVVKFAMQTFRALPTAARLYPAEVFRHAGLLIKANALIVLFMCFIFGAIMGLTVHYVFEAVGISSYVGGVAAAGNMRGILQVVFGWIFAAKVGCGIVAEIGAMRISEEIDAMEVMGIRSVAYLVGTRVLAGIIVIPFLWVAALAIHFISNSLFHVGVMNSVSAGGFIDVLFLFQNARDFVFAMAMALIIALIIMIVGCYYGYHAKGGPIGVGRSTAQSMLVNLVFISLSVAVLHQLFYGTDVNSAIGN